METGLVTGYFTGMTGINVGLFFLHKGKIYGIDAGTGKYLGSYSKRQDGSFDMTVEFSVPPDSGTITGLRSGPEGLKIPLIFHMPSNFTNSQVIKIETPIGTINARFEQDFEIVL
jgi:hypothetical protein